MNNKIRKRKSHINLSLNQQARNKEKIKQALIEVHMLLLSMGLTFGREIEIKPISNGNSSDLLSEAKDIVFTITKFNESSFSKVEELRRFFRFKDENNISDRIWYKLKSCLFPNMPSLYQIKKFRGEMNDMFRIYENSKGVFVSVKEKLTFILSQIIESLDIKPNEILQLKFCGDGTNIGKHIKIFNFGFSCINDKAYCKTSKGHYILGVFEIMNENYDELQVCLSELFEELENIEYIEIKQQKYKIDKILGGDLKFLGIVMGLSSANSNYPCIWCINHKNQFAILELDGSFKGPMARSVCDAKVKIMNKSTDSRKGYAKMPIVKGIDFEKLVVDMLHLFLRITDVLEQHLIIKLKTIDAINDSSSNDNLEKQPTLKKFFDYITNDLKINRVYYIADNQVVLRSLDGDEKLRLFENINIELLFNETKLEKKKEISHVISFKLI
jgi:hypothetical protein